MIYEFHWKAKNRFGHKLKGKSLAENKESLEKKLLQKGYSNLSISRNFVLPTSPKTELVTQILNQISLLLKASIPLKTVLVIVLQNCTNIRLYLWLEELILQLESGFSFSTALEKVGRFMTQQEVQLIKMGETSGQLSTIFGKLVEARQKSENLQKRVNKILFYPVIVLFISITLSLLLLIFIVPQFVELYGTKDKHLPLITEILFSISQFLTESAQTILILISFFLLSFFMIVKKTNIIVHIKFFIFSYLPVFNQIIRQSRIIFFTQNCALMLKAHIRLDLILSSFINTQDSILRKEIPFMLQLLQQGYRLNDGLNPNVFGNDIIQMIAIGEKSGNLAEMMEHISEICQQRLDYQIDLLSQLLEPMLMLIMGVIVGTIIIGLYLPIFDMGNLVE